MDPLAPALGLPLTPALRSWRGRSGCSRLRAVAGQMALLPALVAGPTLGLARTARPLALALAFALAVEGR
eukprot:5816949-Heterocapsa_arctica.AAC.1